MPVNAERRTPLSISTAALTLPLGILILAAPAHAAEPKRNGNGASSDQQGGGDETGIYAAARIQYSGAVTKGGSTGNVTSSDVNWTPPPCWYAPYLGAKDFKKKMSKRHRGRRRTHPAWAAPRARRIGEMERHYEDELRLGRHPRLQGLQRREGRRGDVLGRRREPQRAGLPQAEIVHRSPFWVDNGEPPPPQHEEAITPEMLAALAYQHMELPGTKVTLAPEANTKVNLPTWAWLDEAVFDEIEATAAINVPGFNIQATTTATPKSLTLDPGTEDATTFPANGECPIVDGRIGEPYAKGKAEETPPCGIVYRRSSNGETFPLKASLTWEISWTGTGQAGAVGLPDGTIEAVQDITVKEIQAVNR